MNTNDLLNRYIDAEITPEEERLLMSSDSDISALEKALMQPFPPVPESEEDFDRILRHARGRSFCNLGIALSGIAAAVLTLFILFSSSTRSEQDFQDSIRLLEQIKFISDINPTDAVNYDFRPAGDGFVMTATFTDGSTSSYILTPLDGSFHLLSLNE